MLNYHYYCGMLYFKSCLNNNQPLVNLVDSDSLIGTQLRGHRLYRKVCDGYAITI